MTLASDGVRAFLAGYRGKAQVTWLANVDQFSFYDQKPAVLTSSDTIAKFFNGM